MVFVAINEIATLNMQHNCATRKKNDFIIYLMKYFLSALVFMLISVVVDVIVIVIDVAVVVVVVVALSFSFSYSCFFYIVVGGQYD